MSSIFPQNSPEMSWSTKKHGDVKASTLLASSLETGTGVIRIERDSEERKAKVWVLDVADTETTADAGESDAGFICAFLFQFQDEDQEVRVCSFRSQATDKKIQLEYGRVGTSNNWIQMHSKLEYLCDLVLSPKSLWVAAKALALLNQEFDSSKHSFDVFSQALVKPFILARGVSVASAS
jgi:hypothetical protein